MNQRALVIVMVGLAALIARPAGATTLTGITLFTSDANGFVVDIDASGVNMWDTVGGDNVPNLYEASCMDWLVISRRFV